MVLALSLGLTLLADETSAQSGVSDDRVSVPDGPGSIQGTGENASISENMGMMSYRIPFELPEGHRTATPTLGLSYFSGSGNGVAGIGWDMMVPSIERFALRGLPEYDGDDELAADGGEELVRVATSSGVARYRARFERGFVRYTWHSPGAGGYFTAEYPDGSVGYFGATANGTIVPESRLSDASGRTFRYQLVEWVDVYGHAVRYGYTLVDGAPYLTSVGYVYSGEVPRYTVTLTYQSRPDPFSDGRPGFVARYSQRLSEVSVRVAGEQIRRYLLAYETERDEGGLSRLIGVSQRGRDGTEYPVAFRFRYSHALAGSCIGGGCASPFVVSMGSLPTGSAVGSGDATLVDINGDALPDVLDTSMLAHRFVLNRLDGEGRSSFDPAVRTSTVGFRNPFQTSLANIQPLDVNGDGFADLVNTKTGLVLCNYGTGEWTQGGCTASGELGLELEGDDPDPTGVRFFDVDGDRRMDVIHTISSDAIEVLRNTSQGFVPLQGAEALGVAFDQGSRAALADMNGDGLLDPVHFPAAGGVRYRLNLGFGHWSDWTTMSAPSLSEPQREAVSLEDLNGDGLDDLVLVEPQAVKYALNRSGVSFTAFATINSSVVPGLPSRGPETTVLFADMNANGSQDAVWVQANGAVSYLELFPTPPNLLSRITNGIGMVQTVEYGTAASQRRESAEPWAFPLAIPANVVTRVDTFTTLTGNDDGGLHEVTVYRYRSGFYDGVEKQFRGFASVTTLSPEDPGRDDQEAGRTLAEFDVGATSPYLAGLERSRRTFSGAGASERELLEERKAYGDCAVSGVTNAGLTFPVRHLCLTETTRILKEGAPAAEWATTRSTYAYDGHGSVTLASNLGVVHMGSPEAQLACGACDRPEGSFGAACGSSCLGDESFEATEYVEPLVGTANRWIVGRAHTRRAFGVAGGMTSETRTYYDGAPFTGLPLGQLTRGDATRVTARRETSSDATVALSRASYDAHGNVLVSLDPLGSTTDDTTHRRSYTFDATAQHVVRAEIHLATPEGAPYRLRREYSYDPAFDSVSDATGWMVIEGGANRSARKQTSFRYDAFGRRIAIIRPGDTEDAPSVEYAWHLAEPASRIVERRRSERGGALDLERVLCMDGRGRTYQERTRIDATRYQVSGFVEYNSRGVAVRVYQPYVRASAFCEVEPPTNVLYEDIRHDALAREIHRTYPDAEHHGRASETARRYGPLHTEIFDEEDLDPDSAHANTPTVVYRDGLGRAVAVERRLASGDGLGRTRATYDGLGNLAALIDANGVTKYQTHDLLRRVVAVDDPSSGDTTIAYDDASNVVARTDARGRTQRSTYDGANRLRARWDDADPTGTESHVRYDFGGACAAETCTHAEGRAIEMSYPVDPEVIARLGGAPRAIDQAGFDARGQPVFSARTVAGVRLITRKSFDNAGRLVATTHPDGTTLERSHDGVSRTTGITDVVTDLVYDDRGSLIRVHHANGASDAWERDQRARVVRGVTRAAGDALLEERAYVRDRAGNITRLTHSGAEAVGFEEIEARFSYDARYRLVESAFDGADGWSETLSRTYDAADALLSAISSNGAESTTHLGDLTYDEDRSHAVRRAGGSEYGHDAAGHMVSRDDLTFEWDAFGRLVRATREGSDVVRFSYGIGSSRVSRVEGSAVTLYASDDYEMRDGIGVVHARVGERRVARLESDAMAAEVLGDPAPRGRGNGEVDAADAFIANASAAGVLPETVVSASPATLLRSAARRLLLEAGDGRVALHTDHLGSVVAATDARGQERGRRRFALDAGGDRERGFVDDYGFSGQETIASVGLVRFEHRALDARTMRWTSPDPLFENVESLEPSHSIDAADRYAYVHNNPTNLVDPDGLMPPPGGQVVRQHSRKTEYPKSYRQSTHVEMAEAWTTEGQADPGSVATLAKTSAGRKSLHWVDAQGAPIAPGELTYEHTEAVVDHWNKKGRFQDRGERADFYNDTSHMEAMSRSQNSSEGAQMTARYSQSTGNGYAKD